MRVIIKHPPTQAKRQKPKIPKSPSLAFLDQIINKTLSLEAFLTLCSDDEVLGNLQIGRDSLEFLHTVGMDIECEEERVFLGSKVRKWREQVFCFVDIETTDANPMKGNLLEIGAILCDGGGQVLGRFESLVRNEQIPQIIQDITGITPDEVADAPSVIEVLNDFRKFIAQSVFVAHNVSFDYSFLDFLYRKHFGIGLYNQTLCTLKMAQKMIQAPRYGLSFLNEFLSIGTPISHRAYADALTCKEIFLHCSKLLMPSSTQGLLNKFKM